MTDDFRFEDEQFSFQPEFDPEADFEFPGEVLEAESPKTPVRRGNAGNCRILWPALGFPGVIAPRFGASRNPVDGDSTRCICVLLLSDNARLMPDVAARYLRYTPWTDRTRRRIPAGGQGSFAPRELAVRKLNKAGTTDKNGEGLSFGGNRQGQNAITVSVASQVLRFYERAGMPHLYEVRVAEEASARLGDGQYQIFWNKEQQDGSTSSQEMDFLINAFARPRREKEVGPAFRNNVSFWMNEYRFEYGCLHPPYNKNGRCEALTELLHPLFVWRKLGASVRIGHVTDTHVDVRNDVYERNLPRNYRGKTPVQFNNWNTSFQSVYAGCKDKSDIILLTGDLIDYGRGHTGADDKLVRDDQYHKDRNWFLLYYLLASGGSYKIPVFTSLGNHDWRLNPYPPFAPSTPFPEEFIHNNKELTKREQEQALRAAHGEGHERAFSYNLSVNKWALATFEAALKKPGAAWQAIKGNLDFPGSPVNTDIESVIWYLMLINPFLDYQFALPTGHQFLMLDFGEDEELGKEDLNTHRGYGPRALRCLTPLQQWHLNIFTKPSGPAKTIGIHNPPVGPRPDWYAGDLLAGKKNWERGKSGYSHLYDLPNGNRVEIRQHELYALRPKTKDNRGFDNAPFGIAADYGSFVGKFDKNQDSREWFIKKIAAPGSGVRAVLSGHIHRQGFLVVQRQSTKPESFTIQAVPAAFIRNMRPPAVAAVPGGGVRMGPLYVNTTSAGPRGYQYHDRGQYTSQDPGFSVVTMAKDGTLLSVQHISAPRGAGLMP